MSPRGLRAALLPQCCRGRGVFRPLAALRRRLLVFSPLVAAFLPCAVASAGGNAKVVGPGKCEFRRDASEREVASAEEVRATFHCKAPANFQWATEGSTTQCKASVQQSSSQGQATAVGCVTDWRTDSHIAEVVLTWPPQEPKVDVKVDVTIPLEARIKCLFGAWVRSGVCSAVCGGGVMMIQRRELHGFRPDRCPEETIYFEPCNQDPCQADCELGQWVDNADGSDNGCDAECEQEGSKVQRRNIMVPPTERGKECPEFGKEPRYALRKCHGHCMKDAGVAASVEETRGQDVDIGDLTDCDSYCGDGKRVKVHEAIKLITAQHGGDRPSKKYDHRQESPVDVKILQCNVSPCTDFEVHRVKPPVPEKGKHVLVLVLFQLETLAFRLRLTLPKGFTVPAVPAEPPAKSPPEPPAEPPVESSASGNRCPIEEDNFLSMPHCDVVHIDDKGVRTPVKPVQADDVRTQFNFGFFDPLEPALKEGRVAAYWFRFWAKMPEACESGSDTVCLGEAQQQFKLEVSEEYEPEKNEVTRLVNANLFTPHVALKPEENQDGAEAQATTE